MQTSRLILSTLGLLGLLASPSRSQEPNPPGDPQTEAVPPGTGTPRPDSAATLREALAIIDRLESSISDEAASRGALEELSRRTLDLQAVDPANPWLWYLYGRASAVSGRPGDAIDQLQKFVATRDGRNEWQAYRALGDLFVNEYPRLAKANYEKAVTLKPSEPSVLLGLSVCAARTGEAEQALTLARQAVNADGRRSVRYLTHLARVLAAGQQWGEAESTAAEALRLAEERASAQRGQRPPLQILDAQYQTVIDLISARIRDAAASDDYVRLADYIRRRSQVTVRLSNHERLAVLQRGMDAAGAAPPPRLLEQYAIALAETDQTDKAIAAFEKLLTLEAGNTTAAEWLTRLRSIAPAPD